MVVPIWKMTPPTLHRQIKMTEQPIKKTLDEIMRRPLPEATPEQQNEIDELEELVSKPATQDSRHQTLTEIMNRPMPEITPEQQAELAELEKFFER